jgi:hypothetical protein
MTVLTRPKSRLDEATKVSATEQYARSRGYREFDAKLPSEQLSTVNRSLLNFVKTNASGTQ